MTPKEFAELLRKIENNEIDRLEFGSSNITNSDDTVAAISNALKTNSSLVELNFGWNSLTADSVLLLAKALENPNGHVKTLNLKMCQIRSLGASAISKTLVNPNCHVQILNLRGNGIEAPGIFSLTQALVNPTCKVRELDLSHTILDGHSSEALAQALENPNCSLRVLKLENCFGHGVVEHIFRLTNAIENPNCRLQKLVFSMNRIEVEGSRAFAKALVNPTCQVRELDLSMCFIEDAGIVLLAEALENPHCSLRELNLDTNYIGDAGIKALAKALETNRSLCELKFEPHRITDADSIKKIRKGLEFNLFYHSLPTLGLAPSNIFQFQARCSTLRSNFLNTIKRFGISMPKINDYLVEVEDMILQTHMSLKSILNNPQVPPEEKKTACRATIDMLECLLKPRERFIGLLSCIRHLREEEDDDLQDLLVQNTNIPQLLSYRLLLEAASEVLPTLEESPLLKSFVARLLKQQTGFYNPKIAGQLMAIPQLMSCLGMNPVITSGAAAATSLDSDGPETFLIDCYVHEVSQPPVLQPAIITEKSLVLNQSGLVDLSIFNSPLTGNEQIKSPKP